jgi:hypothetical protein
MKSADALNLRTLWGDQPCSHPDAIALLSDESTPTDNWYCTQCGHEIDIDAWQKADQSGDP